MNDTRLRSTLPTSPALPRRSVLSGAAWSVPVIAVAIATPAAAASTAPEADKGPITGTIAFTPVQYRGTRAGDRVEFPVLTGVVTISRGPLPAKVFLNFSEVSEGRVDLRRDAGRYVAVDPATGRFEVHGVYNAIVGGDNPFGFVYAGVEAEDADGALFGYTVAELIG
ncbi:MULTISPECIES: hypothetical protein [unclassified Rathayibacter]|uniref:hypothetical protein n=1 Tax=unclassified Rathayibacter TaxID=2609250 RepID=UPI001043303E|nr:MULTISPECIES: hypothetical protein [unclassified Rathayibacter]MCJ1703342.1 hypothetical protein [Rathayibacter sp. VKM Ac-2926]TCL85999.1 hypothetical protein EDF49_101668 [Rathayibacter sp. PhB192]TCM31820.1 hypothetical protein EDF43_101668 [Rathayibacter sp. PhB179]